MGIELESLAKHPCCVEGSIAGASTACPRVTALSVVKALRLGQYLGLHEIRPTRPREVGVYVD